MIKFLRRNIGCWEVCEDVGDSRSCMNIPLLKFDTEEELLVYVRTTLPFTKDESEYKLRINDAGDMVVHWSVLGFIK